MPPEPIFSSRRKRLASSVLITWVVSWRALGDTGPLLHRSRLPDVVGIRAVRPEAGAGVRRFARLAAGHGWDESRLRGSGEAGSGGVGNRCGFDRDACRSSVVE